MLAAMNVACMQMHIAKGGDMGDMGMQIDRRMLYMLLCIQWC